MQVKGFLVKAWEKCQKDNVKFLTCIVALGDPSSAANIRYQVYTLESLEALEQVEDMHVACKNLAWYYAMFAAIKSANHPLLDKCLEVLKSRLGGKFVKMTMRQMYDMCL